MKARQTATNRLCRHRVGKLAFDERVSALAIEGDGCPLNFRRAQNQFRETEFAGPHLGALQHALRNTASTIASIQVHAAKLRTRMIAAFDPEHSDDLPVCFDDPEGVALGLREDCSQMTQLYVDGGKNVFLNLLANVRGG